MMCYKRIEQRIRALIKKRDPNDWPFVEDLETSLLSLLAQDAQGAFTLPIETPYHRLIARGVAQYYGCEFDSAQDLEEGEAVACTIRRKAGQGPEVPSVTLLQHVREINTVRTMTEEHAKRMEDDTTHRKPHKRRGNKKKADPALAARLVSLKA